MANLNIDIKNEQERAREEIKKQGFRVLVCAGTGCVANGSLQIIEKFKELGADVSVMSDYDKVTIVPTGCHGFIQMKKFAKMKTSTSMQSKPVRLLLTAGR